MDIEPMTIWVTASQGARLAAMKKRFRLEESAYIEELKGEGKTSREARAEAAAQRAEWWPSVTDLVAAAVRRRLAEPDLAGPWAPLSRAERAQLALAGAWPGPHPGGLVERKYQFPSDLAMSLRTAAWRVSEHALAELRARGLVGTGDLGLSGAQVRTRHELIEKLHPPGRIVRQALTRHGPWTADEA
ncbi:hypothetical protein [Streptomyces sp. NPDC018045]|uniref:hypothetical protein n=1 Tax=Streptomyces sp. NPDC018045 TaxID=3365037 RepID=UPI00378FC9D2